MEQTTNFTATMHPWCHMENKTVESQQSTDRIAKYYRHNASAPRHNTDIAIISWLEKLHPDKHITVTPSQLCDFFAFQASGLLTIEPSKSNGTAHGPLVWQEYIAPASRMEKSDGALAQRILCGMYFVTWKDHPDPFLLYIIEGRDSDYPLQVKNNYIISDDADSAKRLIMAAGKWFNDLHEEIWVFDQGFWGKDKALWKSIAKASWDVVILNHKMKSQLIKEFHGFFDSQTTYERLKVPWKRGLIFHGPPGNGKTISLKAAMNMLYGRKAEVPTLYVKTLTSFGGPEQSLNNIFSKARATAPCLLVFEDLDSIVSDQVRSFFLNQVDGLTSNDGILMVGSTNHLELLDPGISKRPSRFDRKYYFPNPNFDERVLYAQFWRRKLGKTDADASDDFEGNPADIEYPEELCKPIAEITDKFSFAYIQEAFVATLLQIARKEIGQEDDEQQDDERSDLITAASAEDSHPEFDKFVLWKEFKKQVKILRDQLGDSEDDSDVMAGTKQTRAARGSVGSFDMIEMAQSLDIA